MVAGLHGSGGSNLGNDKTGAIHVAVAGDVLVGPGKSIEGGWGPSSVADAWAVGGASIPSQTEGAFTCLVYDSKLGRCFAFNDFIGRGALYYTHFQGATYFSSQISPFLLSARVPPSISQEGLRLYFSFRCIPGRETILAGTKKILPGSIALIGHGDVQSSKYWRIGNARTDFTSSTDEFIERFAALMNAGVQSRLSHSRGQVGILLGGLDSSLIAAFMRRNTSERIVAVTASFDDPRFNERGVRQVSSLLGLDLEEVPVGEERWPEIIEAMAEAYDEPVSDMIASPIAFALVKRSLGQVETFFVGTGGDDLFQGIPHGSGRLGAVADLVPDQARVALRRIYGSQSRVSLPVPALRLLMSSAERELSSWRAMKDSQTTLLLKEGGRWRNGGAGGNLLGPMVSDIASDLQGRRRDPANFSVSTAVSLYFAPVHGYDCCRDRAVSNKYGVSVASPYHRIELYNLALSVPWYLNRPVDGLTKPLLRKIAIRKNLLPPNVVLLTKMGLGSSIQSLSETYVGNWVKNQLTGWITDTLADNLGQVGYLIDRDQAMRLVREKRVRQAFLVLMFVLWYKKYFSDRGFAPPRLPAR
jgi:asparagine synthetase B (glutamine-hydrolysing)